MKKVFSILLLLVLGCSQQLEEPYEKSITRISVDKSNLIKTNYYASDIIDHRKYITLETIDSLNLIGKIDKLVFSENRIFILDRDITKTLFVFSHNGDYISKIDEHGDGPGEFKEPQDFIINNNKITLYCRSNRKFIEYDINGNYIREKRVGLDFRSFTYYNNNYLLFTHSLHNFNEDHGDILYDYIVIDTSFNVINKQFPNDVEVGNSGIVITHNDYFTENKGEYFLSWIFNDTIYLINEKSEAVPFCYFDFNDRSIPVEVFKKRDNVEMYSSVLLDGIYWTKYGPLKAGDNMFLINISAGRSDETDNSLYSMLLSADMNTKVIFKEIIYDDNSIFSFPVSTYKNYFVSVLYPEEMLFNMSNKNRLIKFKGADKYIGEFDNPVLMLTKFKSL